MKQLLSIIMLSLSIITSAQDISIIPKPASVKQLNGTSIINSKTVIVAKDEHAKKSALFLADYIRRYYGLQLPVKPTNPKTNFIRLNVRQFITKPAREGYTLNISGNKITIEADSYEAIFHGVQTVVQLLPVANNKSATNNNINLPNIHITDEPRFSYRGMHLDVARHFFPVSYIKKYIDYLALHKLNTFHWHLTDDQGWRIEIKKHPKLTSLGGWRNGTIIGRYPGKGNDSIRYGGYYTQSEVKEVVKYAAERFITVIPEIEMPGHASAAIAAYPFLSCFPDEDTKVAKGTAWAGTTKGKQVQQAWGVFDDVFCAGKETTFQLLQDVLDEVMPLFPSPIIHIGGDECPKTHWKRCPDCQQRMKENGLKDEHELQSYFIQRMEKYVNSKGKQIIGWDEILEGGLAPNAAVMSWRGEKGGIEAAKQHHNVVMTPQAWCYFDHSQSRNEDSVTIGGYNPIEKTYTFEPVPNQLSAEEAKYILGGQANLWTEYIKNPRKVEYQVFPRMAALSEALWTKKELRDSADFERRLERQFMRYNLWKANYSEAFFEVKYQIEGTNNNLGLILTFPSAKKNQIFELRHWRKLDQPELKPLLDANDSVFGHDTIYEKMYVVGLDKKFILNESGNYDIEAFVVNPKTNQKSGTYAKMVRLNINFNKATGKKITTNFPPSPAYPGNRGAFGLVNGIRADKFASPEWLGWNGKEVELTIDLGKTETVKEVVLHVWKQEPSWIYLPEKVELIFSYNDERGITQFTSLEVEKPEEGWGENRQLKFEIKPQKAFAVTIKLTPLMKIPEGRQGAGNPAWMFLDEVEIN